jgi:hypothetical protein
VDEGQGVLPSFVEVQQSQVGSPSKCTPRVIAVAFDRVAKSDVRYRFVVDLASLGKEQRTS